MAKRKRRKITNNDLQNFIQEVEDRATQTPLKPGGELMCFGRVSNSCFSSCVNTLNEEECRMRQGILLVSLDDVSSWHVRYYIKSNYFEE